MPSLTPALSRREREKPALSRPDSGLAGRTQSGRLRIHRTVERNRCCVGVRFAHRQPCFFTSFPRRRESSSFSPTEWLQIKVWIPAFAGMTRLKIAHGVVAANAPGSAWMRKEAEKRIGRGVWRSIFIPPRGGGCLKGRRGGVVQSETRLECAQPSPSPQPLTHEGGGASAYPSPAGFISKLNLTH